jgi:phosphoenolpyruvate-protein kinase (PTS system EI component)
MKRGQLAIHGMPYVPGVVRGVLCRGGAVAGGIAILSSSDHPPTSAAGLIVVDGAPFSHTLIRQRSAGIPIVIIDAVQAKHLAEGTEVVLDGARGLITDVLDFASAYVAPEAPEAGQPVMTADGAVVQLRASVADAASARAAVLAGAEAIGLVRSEFLSPPAGGVPDAAFYQTAFEELYEAAAPLAVTLRLMDVAPDKTPPWLPAIDAAGGALGLQGARLFAQEPVRSVLNDQLAALDALSERFPLRVLVPYLVRHAELRHWAAYVRGRLSKPLAIGAMVETPAGALDMRSWFDTADFVAIGCNDVMQCLFGADRDLPELHAYLDPYAPPLYRFLKEAAAEAADHLAQVQLCGLLPQLEGVLPILVGLGYRTFSVDVTLIPHMARTLGALNLDDARALAEAICQASDSHEVIEALGLDIQMPAPYVG